MHRKIQLACAALMLVALVLPFSALAQNLPQAEIAQMRKNILKAEAACGDSAVHFKVKRVHGSSDVLAPPAGSARVVVFEAGLGYTDEYFVPSGKLSPTKYKKLPRLFTPTVRMGIDGRWMGALRGNDFIAFSIQPGEHHFCAQFQQPAYADANGELPMTYLSDMKAVAGQTYYFQITYMMIHNFAKWGLELQPLQEYPSRLLLSRSSLVVSTKIPTKNLVSDNP